MKKCLVGSPSPSKQAVEKVFGEENTKICTYICNYGSCYARAGIPHASND